MLVELGVVVVADDQPHGRVGSVRQHPGRVQETLAPLRRLGGKLAARQRGHEVGGELDRVHHAILRRAGMRADALDHHLDLIGGERLHLDLAEPGAVQRVGDIGPDDLEIEVIGAVTDLLVDREHDAHRRARSVVGGEPRDRGHDLRHPRLVVRAEQRPAVARDEIVTQPLGQLGQLGRIEHLALVAGQHDRLTAPGAVDDRHDARAGRIRRRVDVGDQGHHGSVPNRPGRVART